MGKLFRIKHLVSLRKKTARDKKNVRSKYEVRDEDEQETGKTVPCPCGFDQPSTTAHQ